MTRLLAGETQRTDGKLTWNNVIAEAGVPRASAARAKDIIAEWQEALQQRGSTANLDKQNDVRALKAELEERARANAETVNGLRDTIRTMANHIQALTLALDERDRIIADLRTSHAGAAANNVVALRRPAEQH
jgi:hypothetical protein